jgi:hypothetical protein
MSSKRLRDIGDESLMQPEPKTQKHTYHNTIHISKQTNNINVTTTTNHENTTNETIASNPTTSNTTNKCPNNTTPSKTTYNDNLVTTLAINKHNNIGLTTSVPIYLNDIFKRIHRRTYRHWSISFHN